MVRDQIIPAVEPTVAPIVEKVVEGYENLEPSTKRNLEFAGNVS